MKLSRASVGLAVRAAREAAGLTLKDLAGSTGITLNTLSRGELGERDIAFTELVNITKTLQIGVEDLLNLAENCERSGIAAIHDKRSELERDLLALQRLAIESAIEVRARGTLPVA